MLDKYIFIWYNISTMKIKLENLFMVSVLVAILGFSILGIRETLADQTEDLSCTSSSEIPSYYVLQRMIKLEAQAGGSGSGVQLDKYRVLTAKHVANGVVKEYPTLSASEPKIDVATVRKENQEINQVFPIRIHGWEKYEEGWIAGYPLGSPGVVLTKVHFQFHDTSDQANKDVFSTEGAVYGSSGSPIISCEDTPKGKMWSIGGIGVEVLMSPAQSPMMPVYVPISYLIRSVSIYEIRKLLSQEY